MRESAVEKYAVEKIRGVGGRAFKWVSPGIAGVPDRICVFPEGRIIFVEFKRPGLSDGRSPRQKKITLVLEKLGCTVRRIGSKEELRDLMEEIGYAL